MVHWLNEALCFVSSFVVADSLVLRNRQLLVAAIRQTVQKRLVTNHFYGYIYNEVRFFNHRICFSDSGNIKQSRKDGIFENLRKVNI